MNNTKNNYCYILIVDDSKVIHSVIKNYLSEEYTIFSAFSSEEARSALKNNSINLILLDVNMPGESGIELCQSLKASEYKDIPIIFISGETKSSTIADGLRAGANDYLIKPFNKEELSVRIETHNRILNLQKEKEQIAKMKAAQALIVTMNHEINNPLFIALMKIKSIFKNQKKLNADPVLLKQLTQVDISLERINKIMKDVRQIETFEITKYVDQTSMLDISKSKK